MEDHFTKGYNLVENLCAVLVAGNLLSYRTDCCRACRIIYSFNCIYFFLAIK